MGDASQQTLKIHPLLASLEEVPDLQPGRLAYGQHGELVGIKERLITGFERLSPSGLAASRKLV